LLTEYYPNSYLRRASFVALAATTGRSFFGIIALLVNYKNGSLKIYLRGSDFIETYYFSDAVATDAFYWFGSGAEVRV
jgi:hypothetical protein